MRFVTRPAESEPDNELSCLNSPAKFVCSFWWRCRERLRSVAFGQVPRRGTLRRFGIYDLLSHGCLESERWLHPPRRYTSREQLIACAAESWTVLNQIDVGHVDRVSVLD